MAVPTHNLEKLTQLNYLYALDLQQLFNSILQIADESDVSAETIKISSLARIGAGFIDPFLFDQLEELVKATQEAK